MRRDAGGPRASAPAEQRLGGEPSRRGAPRVPRAGLRAVAAGRRRELEPSSPARTTSRADLAAKVTFLQDSASYPEETRQVEAIETHMAWVFLTDRHAYKLKKPVRYEFLDFSTLAARKRTCEEEVRLNRRLAADVYLGVVPLTETDAGDLELDGDGPPIEWLVKMRRLPRELMLDEVIRRQAVGAEDIRRLARVLADFHAAAASVELCAETYRERLRRDLEANLQELSRPEFGLPQRLIDEAGAAQGRFLERRRVLLEGRVRAGRVVEGHGDVRPEHVCLEEPPVVIDCIEFNREFRIVDAADEIAFLWLECERLGASSIGPHLLEAYGGISGDTPPPELMRFYMSCRACLRAKLAAWHTTDSEVDDHAGWLGRAHDYLRRAAEHARSLAR